MSDRLSKLLKSFSSHISVPWGNNISAEEKAIFVVYDKEDELKLRARMTEFEHACIESEHPWLLLDLTNEFPTGWPDRTTKRLILKIQSIWKEAMTILLKSLYRNSMSRLMRTKHLNL